MIASNPLETRKTPGKTPLHISVGTWLCSYFDLSPLTSRTARQYVLSVSRLCLVVFRYNSPRKPTEHPVNVRTLSCLLSGPQSSPPKHGCDRPPDAVQTVLSYPYLHKLMDQTLIILKQMKEPWSCLQLHRSVKSLLDKYKMDY